MPAPPVTIQAESLVKRYRRHLAVDQLSFQVREGEICALLGPNGAGKTSTMRMLVGLPDRIPALRVSPARPCIWAHLCCGTSAFSSTGPPLCLI
jgi:ATPase subunit of ABC transporter with duplicated ATPase domains